MRLRLISLLGLGGLAVASCTLDSTVPVGTTSATSTGAGGVPSSGATLSTGDGTLETVGQSSGGPITSTASGPGATTGSSMGGAGGATTGATTDATTAATTAMSSSSTGGTTALDFCSPHSDNFNAAIVPGAVWNLNNGATENGGVTAIDLASGSGGTNATLQLIDTLDVMGSKPCAVTLTIVSTNGGNFRVFIDAGDTYDFDANGGAKVTFNGTQASVALPLVIGMVFTGTTIYAGYRAPAASAWTKVGTGLANVSPFPHIAFQESADFKTTTIDDFNIATVDPGDIAP